MSSHLLPLMLLAVVMASQVPTRAQLFTNPPQLQKNVQRGLSQPHPQTYGKLPPSFKVHQRQTGAQVQTNATATRLSFAGAIAYSSGGHYAESVSVADVNGDGQLDLIVANAYDSYWSNGSVAVLLGNGDGTFRASTSYNSGGHYPQSVAVGDVNGDGKPDLIVVNEYDSYWSNGSVAVLLGNGDGTFQQPVNYGSGGLYAMSVAVADVNGDGRLDLIVANQYGSNWGGDGTVAVLFGNGDGTFQQPVNYGSSGLYAMSVAVADVNGDNKVDLIVANDCASASSYPYSYCSTTGTVAVLLGNGDGTFQQAVTYSSGGLYAQSVAVEDVNGDDKPDLLVTNSCDSSNNCSTSVVSVLLGNGDGIFQQAVTYGAGSSPRSIAAQDVNGDGKPDLIMSNSCISASNCSDGAVAVLRNGEGAFQAAVSYGSGGLYARSVAVGDINADGKPDLIVANECNDNNCSNGSVAVLRNTSLGLATAALVSSLNPSAFAQSVTFTATVTSQGFKGSPTGAVDFFDGTTKLGTSSLTSSAVATLTISTLSRGTHNVSAVYNGDVGFASSTSPVLSQVVQGDTVHLSKTVLDFGNQTVGGSSAQQSVALTTDEALSISSITISGPFVQTNNCGNSLPAGGSCQINLTFAPSTRGLQTGTLAFIDNSIGSPQTISLSGTGTQPETNLFPTSLDFGNQPVSVTSNQQVVTLTNSGNGILSISALTVVGTNSSEFAQTNNCGTSVPVGGSCMIIVTFTPSSTGTRSATVSIVDNALDSPQKVPLAGVGSSLSLGASPTSATVSPGGSATYIISENGFSGAINLSCSVFGVGASAPTCSLSPASINPGNASTLVVNTTAANGGSGGTTAGTYGIMVMGTSAGGLTASFSVTLTVIAGAVPTFTVGTSTASISVMAGSSAAYPIFVTPHNGFNSLVSLSCSVPSNAKLGCSLNPTSVTPGVGSMLTVTTTASTLASQRNGKLSPLYAMLLPIPGIAFAGIGSGSRRRKLAVSLLLILISALLLVLGGCGGGGGAGGGGGGNTIPGTPIGSYNVVVTATSGSMVGTMNVSLTVR